MSQIDHDIKGNVDASELVCVLCYDPNVMVGTRMIRKSDLKEPHYDKIIAPHSTVVGFCSKCIALVLPQCEEHVYWTAVAEERARAAVASGVPTRICRAILLPRDRTRGGLN